MPPTKATSPSTMTSFSWWQCIGPLMRVELTSAPAFPEQLISHADVPLSERGKNRKRRAGPQQHPDLDPLGQLAEQIAQAAAPLVACQSEVGGEMPTRDVHMRASVRQRLGDAGQRLGAVDEDLKRTTAARRGSPATHSESSRRIELIQVAHPTQPATVMLVEGDLHPTPDKTICGLMQHDSEPSRIVSGPWPRSARAALEAVVPGPWLPQSSVRRLLAKPPPS